MSSILELTIAAPRTRVNRGRALSLETEVPMRWDQVSSMCCSIARSLAIFGDRWTLLIIRNAFLGASRFDQFQAGLGMTRHLLSSRLARLVEEGVLARVSYQTGRYEYRLTEKGLDLLPILLAMTAWGDRWLDDGEGPPTQIIHRTCGQATHPTIVCSECSESLTAANARLIRRAATGDPA